MEYDKDKVDAMTLALLYLKCSTSPYGTRAWKGPDWEALDRLEQKGYLIDPRGKSPSMTLTEAGARLSKELFVRHFDAKE